MFVAAQTLLPFEAPCSYTKSALSFFSPSPEGLISVLSHLLTLSGRIFTYLLSAVKALTCYSYMFCNLRLPLIIFHNINNVT